MIPERPTRRLELVGSSPKGMEQAIDNAIEGAGQTIRDLDWFDVKAIRGNIKDGGILWQVKLGVSFLALDPTDLPKNQ